MSDDLVKRLRDADRYNAEYYVRDPLHKQAADRIEELEAKLEKAVEAFSYYADHDKLCLYDDMHVARTALAELKGEN